MPLQRISDFVENQVGVSSFCKKFPQFAFLHTEVFAQIHSANGIILNNFVWFSSC
ncbi:hypothetical protein SAMN06295945_0159 [Polynucleobacter meluiroseus]|uniref:Uncharacterized protein n=1 Tax=Polynucleobacter meluiroseus TaxID=1938814 RepID=A0A240DY41_9BURK|nr:hypothetical protein SAMN06295945_0159 [Polynucleobacter meluiroseus]